MATSTERLINLKCPSCGAELEVAEGRDICFCTYCGAKILIKQSDAEVKARSRERIVSDITNKANQFARERREYKERKEKESFKKMLISFGIMIIGAVLFHIYMKYFY